MQAVPINNATPTVDVYDYRGLSRTRNSQTRQSGCEHSWRLIPATSTYVHPYSPVYPNGRRRWRQYGHCNTRNRTTSEKRLHRRLDMALLERTRLSRHSNRQTPDHAYIYVVTADGNWYYYNDETPAWTAGGLFIDSSGYDALDIRRLTTAEGDITTLNADDTTEGSVAKTVKDAVEPIDTRVTYLESVRGHLYGVRMQKISGICSPTV